MTDELVLDARCYDAYEAQLRQTVETINSSLQYHSFADDSGDYLCSVLDLSAFLQVGAMDGVGGLLPRFKELAKESPDNDDGSCVLENGYAEYAKEVHDLVKELGGRFPFEDEP